MPSYVRPEIRKCAKNRALSLALVDECIRWYNHERIKQSLGWMSPIQYRQSQGMAA